MKSVTLHPAIAADNTYILTLDDYAPFTPQIISFFESLPVGAIEEGDEVCLPDSAQAAAAMLPIMEEILAGLPTMTLFGTGRITERLGNLNLADYHNEVRSRRSEIPEGEAFSGITILDGTGRGVTNAQLKQFAKAKGVNVEDIRIINVSTDHVDPAAPQQGLIDKFIQSGLTKADWTNGRVMLLLPGFGPLAAVMYVTAYGLSEVWLPIPRLNYAPNDKLALAEIIDVQNGCHQFGAHLAAIWCSLKPTVTFSGDIPADFRRLVKELAKAHGVTVRMIIPAWKAFGMSAPMWKVPWTTAHTWKASWMKTR